MRFLVLALLVGCGGSDAAVDALPPDADPCTGTCECKVDADCAGDFSVCIDDVTNRTCGCSAGYTKGASGCAWTGGIVRDPSFQSAGAWTTPTGTLVDGAFNETGMLDPGAGRIVGTNGLCALARIRQPLEMPKQARSQPLVAEISHRFRTNMGPALPARPSFGMGTTWSENVVGNGNPWLVTRVCLGPGQYAPADSKGRGAIVELGIMPNIVASPCADPSSLDIDRFDIKPANAGECPAAGSALNGDAEDTGGWILASSSANMQPHSATLAAGVGEGGTRGVRLFAQNRCSDLSATTKVSIPVAATSAFAFFNKTTTTLNNVETEPFLGGIALPSISAAAVDQPQRVCVPAPMRGAVVDFSAFVSLAGTCAEQVNATSIIDNVRIVDDASCGTNALIADPSFESSLQLIGASATPGKSLSRILMDPAQARTGSGVLQLSVTQECDGPTWTGNIVVPESLAAAGPALKFFYKATPAGKYRFGASVGATSFTPTLDGQYREGRICLNPKLAGRAQTVVFRMSAVGGHTCANTIAAETAYVDDLSATNDAACPAN